MCLKKRLFMCHLDAYLFESGRMVFSSAHEAFSSADLLGAEYEAAGHRMTPNGTVSHFKPRVIENKCLAIWQYQCSF
jgi:hypothetical protein